MAEDIKRSDLLLSLIKLEKDKGFVSLVDVIAAKKAYCNADKSLKHAQKAMDEAECAYNSINMMKKAW